MIWIRERNVVSIDGQDVGDRVEVWMGLKVREHIILAVSCKPPDHLELVDSEISCVWTTLIIICHRCMPSGGDQRSMVGVFPCCSHFTFQGKISYRTWCSQM